MRGWMMVSAAMALWVSPFVAQETRVAEEGHVPPSAGLAQMDWLVGQWTGTGIGGAPAMESWLPPSGNTMVGTFVQETGDGAIRFTEHLYLMEEEGTLVLRLKHFNADLTGWEEKDKMLTFRLIAVEDCAAYFHALTLRCDGSDGLLAAVRMKSDEPAPQELVFRFRRAGMVAFDDCGAMTTPEYVECFSKRAAAARNLRDTYLSAARDAYATDAATLQAIEASHLAFGKYLDAECSAIRMRVRQGTMGTSEHLLCQERLMRRQAHAIWKDWLGRPFVETDLPEPELP